MPECAQVSFLLPTKWINIILVYRLYFVVHMINTSTLECLVCDLVLFFCVSCDILYIVDIPRRKYLYPVNGLVGL